MILSQLLEELGYSQSQNYHGDNSVNFEPVTEHFFRAAKRAGVKGSYLFKTSPPGQELLPARPAVYIAEAKTRDDAQKIHRNIWNLGNTPFLIILLPDEIRIYTGFDYSSKDEQAGLINKLQNIANQTHEAINNYLHDFKADSIDSGRIWQSQAKHLVPEKRVDWHLLNNLRKLSEYLVQGGLDLTVAHALIGKYIYIRYLRDREILSTTWLKENNVDLASVLGRNATRAGLLHLIEILESRFNGAIFPFPPGSEKVLSDKIISDVASTFKGDDPETGQFHLDFDAYNFSYIPVETLSAIYEQFLCSRGIGRSIGAVYTPEPLADYLLCEIEQAKSLKKGMKILDPCCGSGIFLVLAYRRLIEIELLGSENGKLKPTELRRILCESIYGIERNREACYVTEFSLILTLLNYVEPPDLHRNKQFQFPDMHNTQIFQCDFFDDESQFWKRKERFDWIIGNPPWIELKPENGEEEKARLWIKGNMEKRPATGNRVSEAFSWRVDDLLLPDGYISLILPAKSLFNHESEKYRRLFFAQHAVARITNFSNLAYVLFGGRGEAPAATITYCKSQPGIDKQPIIHYGPFVANQIPNRPWKSNKKNSTWAITIYSNEIQTVSPEDAESGASSVWKIALWGGHRDKMALKKIRKLFTTTLDELANQQKWHLYEGLQVGPGSTWKKNTESENIEKVLTSVDSKFDSTKMNKSQRLFSIPECALQSVTNLRYRIRSGTAGLKVSTAPHIVISAKYAVYSDKNFIIPLPKIGISGPDGCADYLRAISVLLSSSILRYYMFFNSSSLGVDRNVIGPRDIKEIPIPILTADQITSLSAFQKTLSNLENDGLSTEIELRTKLDDFVEKILNFPENLGVITRDFNQIRCTLNKGKAVVPATGFPKTTALSLYGHHLRDELDSFSDGSGLRHKVSLIHSKYLIVCAVEFLQSEKAVGVSVEKLGTDNSLLFASIHEQTKQRFSQWVYVQRSLRIFEESRVVICKAPRLIDWTRTQALNDSDDIISEILSTNYKLNRAL